MTGYIKTSFRTARDIEKVLIGTLIRHKLTDGTEVLAVIDGSRQQYCTARIVEGPLEGRTVRLGDSTRRA
jgi:hypothetical protein